MGATSHAPVKIADVSGEAPWNILLGDRTPCGTLYWGTDTGSLQAANLATGTIATTQVGQSYAWVEAVTDQYVYLIVTDGAETIKRVSRSGGTVEVIDAGYWENPSGGLLVDASSIYRFRGTAAGCGLDRMDLDGSVVTKIVALYTAADTCVATQDASNLYVVEAGIVTRIPKNGDTPTILGTSADGLSAYAMDIDGSSLYWLTWDEQQQEVSLESIPLAGGSVATLAHLGVVGDTERYWPYHLLFDRGYLYLLELDTAGQSVSLVRVPSGGGPPEVVLANLPGPRAFAMDTSSYYISENLDQSPRATIVEIAQ